MRLLPSILLILLSTIGAAFAFSENEPYRVTSKADHEMKILNSGMGALYARIDMIRRAKTSIDLETYIFDADTSGKLILNELKEAAKRGVKVRILADKAPGVHKLDEHMARVLKENNVEVRYYNPAPVVKLSTVQFRNHRKLMVIDGEEAITGGRNIADEYYDLSKRFNFLDRDAKIKGPIVKSMGQTFENFWNSRLVETPRPPELPRPQTQTESGDSSYNMRLLEYEAKEKKARALFDPDEKVSKALKIVETHGKERFEDTQTHTCPEVSFASDREGGSFVESLNPQSYSKEYRLLREEILKWMDQKVKDEVMLDTPYFLKSPVSEKLIQFLNERKAKIDLFTNSLNSSDAIPVSSVFGHSITSFTPFENFKAYVYKGKYSGESKLHDDAARNTVWGTHSKSMVFSKDSFMIGSFNIDNRSSYYNTELAVMCSGSPELTKDVSDNIRKRMDNSFRLNASGDGEDCDIHKDVGAFKLFLYYLLKIPSHMLQDLL